MEAAPARLRHPPGGLTLLWLSDRGKIRSRRVTRVSAQQQRLPARAIKNAREMALLPYASR
ncbi:30S ribosomal protein S18 [Streptomyces aurantiacus]|uniref:30S ribosomal protein S18 n=1 Tax=Streptomyces aurantiacus TaxID=47760 RepID=UPI001FE0F8DF|nr:30S ribosomal protein S18 [Streptomyces aurantiacus]